ncbi:MAG: hypothetical protein AAF443_07490 [Chlamydiota bacterium]
MASEEFAIVVQEKEDTVEIKKVVVAKQSDSQSLECTSKSEKEEFFFDRYYVENFGDSFRRGFHNPCDLRNQVARHIYEQIVSIDDNKIESLEKTKDLTNKYTLSSLRQFKEGYEEQERFLQKSLSK